MFAPTSLRFLACPQRLESRRLCAVTLGPIVNIVGTASDADCLYRGSGNDDFTFDGSDIVFSFSPEDDGENILPTH